MDLGCEGKGRIRGRLGVGIEGVVRGWKGMRGRYVERDVCCEGGMLKDNTW